MIDENKLKRIEKLSDDWYKLIGGDHHKDKDCHFYVMTSFSYGQSPKYSIQHYGYMGDDFDEEYGNYSECLQALEENLKVMIHEESARQKRGEDCPS